MNKSVLISIQPYYVFLIIARLMGWNIPQEKTVEVRKDFPKDPLWNKCVHIYCSKNRKSFNRIPKQYQPFMEKLLGKVACRFVCDEVCEILGGINDKSELDKACLTEEETAAYLGRIDTPMCYTIYGIKKGYAWHISDLKIYEKPKELGEFTVMRKCTSCKDSGYESSACEYDGNCLVPVSLKKTFQSWGYVCSKQ